MYYICVFVSNNEKICLMVIIYNPSFICIYRYRHCGRYLHGLQYAKTTTMQVVVLTPHLSYSPPHPSVHLFVYHVQLWQQVRPPTNNWCFELRQYLHLQYWHLCSQIVGRVTKKRRKRKSLLGRFPSWPNAAPRTFILDRVVGSQEGSNMIHDGGGTKKGVEYSMIFFYKIVTPLPPYMQSGNITFLQHLDKCAFSRTLALYRNFK